MSEKKAKTLIVVAGPTAVGKTACAIQLAQHFQTEIVSADSRQIYKELNIGVARPSVEELSAAKHHLIAYVSVNDYYNVSRYEQDALLCLEDIFKQNDVAVLVGGSGMYIDVLCKGIAQLPDADPVLRQQLQKDFEEHGLEPLQEKLKILDPDYFREMDTQNPVRVLRALEVCLQTGFPFSSFRNNEPQERPFNIVKIGLTLEREILNERIHKRIDQMLNEGLLAEVETLRTLEHLPALRTVGYSEFFKYFNHEWSFEEALEKMKTNTRRYAKRQMTWFRKSTDMEWFSPFEKEKILQYLDTVL